MEFITDFGCDCELRGIFSSPAGGEEKYEQWGKCPLVLYAKPSNKRFIIPLQKKLLFCNWLPLFLVRVFKNILIPSVRMTLTRSKICKRFEPRSHFKSRLCLIVGVNVVLNRTVVVDSDYSPIKDYVHPDDQTQPTFEMSKMFARIICQTIE